MATSTIFAQNGHAISNLNELSGRKIPKSLLNRVSIGLDNAPLELALADIVEKGQINLSYDRNLLPLHQKVSVHMDNVYAIEALIAVLQQTSTVLEITKSGDLAIIPAQRSNKHLKGQIRGIVIDSTTGSALPGANVIIKGTTLGAATNLKGEFILPKVLPGAYTVVIRYMGYKTKEIKVKVHPKQIINLKIKLIWVVVKGKSVEITAQASGQLSAINQQLSSNTIKNVVSPQRLQENPDANAAEAIGRLPGLSLIRSGGEGVAIVIRGMGPQYSTVALNGVQLPSTNDLSRYTSVSGISQFLLQTVEVYKAITPDMDGNSVAGSVNLKFSEAPDSLHFRFLTQRGYNNQNNYWGNYRLVGNVSDRFFDKKLGVNFIADAERVNRSTETMSANYGVFSNTQSGLGFEQVLLNNAALNDINHIKSRQAGTLVLDYSFSPSSKLFFYNFFSHYGSPYINVSKNFSPGANQILYNFYQDKGTENSLFSSSIRGEHNLSSLEIDYGAAFSQMHKHSPNRRSWGFSLQPAFNDQYVNNKTRLLPPEQIVGLSNENSANLRQTFLLSMGFSSDKMLEKDITSYFDAKIRFKLSNSASGYIKSGVKYKQLSRERKYIAGSQTPCDNPFFIKKAASEFNWITLNSNEMTALGLVDHNVTNFLGNYNFGWYPRMDRLNDLWDWWNNYSNNLMAKGVKKVIGAVGSPFKIGFPADFYNSSINNQNLNEKYLGTYLMSEINFGNLITFMPGVRYEKVTDNLIGHYVMQKMFSMIYGLNIPSNPVNAMHNDEYWLPMIHLKIKPINCMHINLSYTNALSRPSYSALIPNTYINNGMGTHVYITGNPYLKPELWTNYDLQLAFFENKIGLFDIDGFYKKVKNKIWSRSYYRIKGDPLLPGFKDNDMVLVTETSNHKDPGYLKGIELEWQTNFWYFPKPFNYFSLNFNYTLLKSEIQYPTTRIYTTYQTDSRGRPIPTIHRVDSTITNQLINQPNNIANMSLGFNYKGLDAWLSFQFTGAMLTGWSYQRELIPHKDNFYRWDFQVVQKLPIKGMELVFNVANINDIEETSRLSGDSRPTNLERYGWTTDMGIRLSLIHI